MPLTNHHLTTLRVNYPNWQGGNNPVYYLGAQLLASLLPDNPHQQQITIPVKQPDGSKLAVEEGIIARQEITQTIHLAMQAITRYQPDRIITIGGDCLISQAPFDYLHGKYQRELGIIWIDAHPDISNPNLFEHAHAMVLANLLHHGDHELAALVKNPFTANQILYLGLQQPNKEERAILAQLNINYQDSRQGLLSKQQVVDWITTNQFKKIAIHLDLDVLNPTAFHSLYFNNPKLQSLPDNAAIGNMVREQLVDYLLTIFQTSDVVGFSIAEYLPWDAYYLQQLFQQLPIFKQ